MSKSSDKLITCRQVEDITGDTVHVELDNLPIPKSLWFIFDECENVILYNYEIYNGYTYSDKEDVRLVLIVEEIPTETQDGITYVTYDNAEDYLDSLYSKVCYNYTSGRKEIVTSDMFSGDQRDAYIKAFNKNLIGKCFIDWDISEQIKEMITKNDSQQVQINYWYQSN